MTRYEIRAGKNAPCELVSIVPVPVNILPGGIKWGGTDAVNFVCDGTHTYCKSVKDKLEAMK